MVGVKIKPSQEVAVDDAAAVHSQYGRGQRFEFLIKLAMIPFSVLVGLVTLVVTRYAYVQTPSSLWFKFAMYMLINAFRVVVILYPFSWWRFAPPGRQKLILCVLGAIGVVVDAIIFVFITFVSPVAMNADHTEMTSSYTILRAIQSLTLWGTHLVVPVAVVVYCKHKHKRTVLEGKGQGQGTKSQSQSSEEPHRKKSRSGSVLSVVASYCALFFTLGAAIAMFSLDFVLSAGLTTLVAVTLPFWIGTVWWVQKQKRPRSAADIDRWCLVLGIQALFYGGTIPTGASSLFSMLLDRAQNNAYDYTGKFVLQLGVVLLWNVLLWGLQKIAAIAGKFAFVGRDGMLVTLPVLWAQHYFARSIFMSGMGIEVLVVVIVFAVAKSLIRDSGVWRNVLRRVRRQPNWDQATSIKQWREDQVWLECNWLNVIATSMLLAVAAADLYAPGLGGVEVMVVGLDRSNLSSALFALGAISVLSGVAHFVARWLLYHRLRRLRATPSAWHLKSIYRHRAASMDMDSSGYGRGTATSAAASTGKGQGQGQGQGAIGSSMGLSGSGSGSGSLANGYCHGNTGADGRDVESLFDDNDNGADADGDPFEYHDASRFWRSKWLYLAAVIGWGSVQGIVRSSGVRYGLYTGKSVLF